MSDRHLTLLRTAARARQHDLDHLDDTPEAGHDDAAEARRSDLQDRATRTRASLKAAIARRTLTDRHARNRDP